jgi:4-hydroxy-tetrahydrodipicolinate reductase
MTVRTVHWGTGAIGLRALARAADDPAFDVAAVVSVRGAERARQALAEAAPELVGVVPATGDLRSALSAAGGADVVLLATAARLAELREPILEACELGLHVVCVGEDAAYPASVDAAVAEELDAAARRHEVCIIGTGVNPGYVMDFLPLVLTAPTRRLRSLYVRRVSDLSDYGETVLSALGIGLTLEEFEEAVRAGRVGHLGFEGSVAFIAAGLGVSVEITANECVPITRSGPTVVAGRKLPAGVVIGVEHRCEALTSEGQKIVLEHPQRAGTQEGEEEPHDLIEVEGEPVVRFRISSGLDGGSATVGLLLNLAHAAVVAPPGLQTMATIPLSAALGKARARNGARSARTPEPA